MDDKAKLGVDKLPIPYFVLSLGFIGLLLAAIGGWYYTGLNNQLGEWQFANFGIYLNLTTILIFVALIALMWRIGRAFAKRDKSKETENEDLRRNLTYTTLAQKLVTWLAMALLFSSAVTFIYMFLLPSSDEDARQITILQAANGAEGPARLLGMTAIGPSARYSQGFLFWKRTYYFMPVASERRVDKTIEANVFIEVPAKLAQSKSRISINGILRRDALPDEVATMYRNANFPVAQNASVMFAGNASSNWAARVLIYNLLLLGFMSLAFGQIFKRKRRRLEKQIFQS